MKRLLIAITLIGLVYVLGSMILSEISVFVNDASLIVSGINRSDIRNQIREYINHGDTTATIILGDSDIKIERVNINTDSDTDIIATIDNEKTCGTGGCVTIILLNDGFNHFTLIPFKYSVKSLNVEDNITNGMHDLEINNDADTLMIWDGEQYRLNSL